MSSTGNPLYRPWTAISRVYFRAVFGIHHLIYRWRTFACFGLGFEIGAQGFFFLKPQAWLFQCISTVNEQGIRSIITLTSVVSFHVHPGVAAAVPYHPRIIFVGYPRCSLVVPLRLRIAMFLRGSVVSCHVHPGLAVAVPYHPRIIFFGYPSCSLVVPLRIRIALFLRGSTRLQIYQLSFVCRALGDDSHDQRQHEELTKRNENDGEKI